MRFGFFLIGMPFIFIGLAFFAMDNENMFLTCYGIAGLFAVVGFLAPQPKIKRMYMKAKHLYEKFDFVYFDELKESDFELARNSSELIESEKIFKELLIDANKNGARYNAAIAQYQLGLISMRQGLVIEAKKLFLNCLTELKGLPNSEVIADISDASFRLGEIDFFEGDYESAKKRFKEGLDIDTSRHSDGGILMNNRMLDKINKSRANP